MADAVAEADVFLTQLTQHLRQLHDQAAVGNDQASAIELHELALACEEARTHLSQRVATTSVGVAGLAALGAAGPTLVNQWLLPPHLAMSATATAASAAGEAHEGVAAEAIHVEYTVHDAPDHGAHAAAGGGGPGPALPAAEWDSLFAPAATSTDGSDDATPLPVGLPVPGAGLLPASAAAGLAVPVHWCYGPSVRAVALFRPAAVVAATLRALRQRGDVGGAAWAAAAAAGLGALGLADPLPPRFRTVLAPTGHGRVATWTFSSRKGEAPPAAAAGADDAEPIMAVTRAQLAAVRTWLATYVCGAHALWGLLFTVRIELPLPSLRGRRISLLPSQDARTHALVATGALAVVPALAELDGLLVCVPAADTAGAPAAGARAIALTSAVVHLATQPPAYPVLAMRSSNTDDGSAATVVLLSDNPLATAPLASLALTSSILTALDGAIQAAPPSATWPADNESGWTSVTAAVAARWAHNALLRVRSHVVARLARLLHHARVAMALNSSLKMSQAAPMIPAAVHIYASQEGRTAALADAVSRSVQTLYVETMRPVFASLLAQAAVHAATANADALLDALAQGPLAPLDGAAVALDVAAAHLAPIVHRTLLALRDWLTPPLPTTTAADGGADESTATSTGGAPSVKRRRTATAPITPAAAPNTDVDREGTGSGGEGEPPGGAAATEATAGDVAFSGVAHMVVLAVIDRVLLARGGESTTTTAGPSRRHGRGGAAAAAKDHGTAKRETMWMEGASPSTTTIVRASTEDAPAGELRTALLRLRPDIARGVQAITHAAMEAHLRAVATALPLRLARLASAERKRLAMQLATDSPLPTVRAALHDAMGRIGTDTIQTVLFELDSALAHVLPQVVMPTLSALVGRMYVARFTQGAAAQTAAGQAWCARVLNVHSDVLAYRQQLAKLLARLQTPATATTTLTT